MGFKAVPILPLLKEEEVSVSFLGHEEGGSGNEFKHSEIIAFLISFLRLICYEEKRKKRGICLLCLEWSNKGSFSAKYLVLHLLFLFCFLDIVCVYIYIWLWMDRILPIAIGAYVIV